MKSQLVCIMFMTVLTFACAPNTRVVLLPDDSGKVGQVCVKTNSEQITLTKSFETTQVGSFNQATPVEIIDSSVVNKKYKSVLDAEPLNPLSFLFYFEHNSTIPLHMSSEVVDKIVQSVSSKDYTEIMVIGHTDSTGDQSYNTRLSLRRASKIRRLLISEGVPKGIITIESFGEQEPLIPSVDNKSVPENRRVEVLLR